MAKWLRRLFSPTFRRALAAEAAGDYVAAAEAYALGGQPEKVAEMHLVRAGRVDDTRRVDSLDDALRWLTKADPLKVKEGFRGELAEALVAEAKALPEGDPRRKRLGVAGARLHEEEGRLREAGEAFELAGKSGEASRCYEAAGAIEEMERLLEVETAVSSDRRKGRDAFDDYESAMARGARDAARAALRRCIAVSPGRGYEGMLAKLEEKLPRSGVVEVSVDGVRLFVVGRAPAILGRGNADVPLRHAGISRRHAAIDMDEGGFALRDAGSRNGTTLSGLDISGQVKLLGSGTIGLGDECSLEFAVRDGLVELQVLDGPDRGLRAVVTPSTFYPSPKVPFGIGFKDDMCTAEDREGDGFLLNGAKVAGQVVLLVGDVVEGFAGGRVEVLG